jgi:hypothetical protein
VKEAGAAWAVMALHSAAAANTRRTGCDRKEGGAGCMVGSLKSLRWKTPDEYASVVIEREQVDRG